MRVPGLILNPLRDRLMRIPAEREPDEIIGPGFRSRLRDGPHRNVPDQFLKRWFLKPKDDWHNRYLHCFTKDDEDRALHDHPWWNLSILLDGSYYEHTIAKGGVHHRQLLTAGDMKLRAPWDAHRVECIKVKGNGWSDGGWYGKPLNTHHAANAHDPLPPDSEPEYLVPVPCWSLFLTGPVQHGWGFHCPGEWKPHKKFGADNGCGEAGKIKGYHDVP